MTRPMRLHTIRKGKSHDNKSTMTVIRIVLFELEEYESSKISFEYSKQLKEQNGKDLTIVTRWIRKCDAELSAGRIFIALIVI